MIQWVGNNPIWRLGVVMLCSGALTACSATLERLEQVGKQPPMTQLDNPQVKQDYKPLTWPTPQPAPPDKQYVNSLWQPGARAFFRDQRAARVGDILRVSILINDRADVLNNTDRNRTTEDTIEAPEVFGLEDYFDDVLIGSVNPESLLDLSSEQRNRGQSIIRRQERINTNLAAVITQVLPNGHFVIHGTQEIRINFEIREIAISGIVRPEDIDSTNTVDYTQVAEARIIYGGRGQLTDVQQSRWGSQVIDIVSPF